MFAQVAPRYDLCNHLLSGFLDLHWRRVSARSLRPLEGKRVLDLCCGTGDQAVALQRQGARVVAADFCIPMLSRAEGKYDRLSSRRPAGLAGDTLELPFEGGGFDAATVSFGLRNVADLDAALVEIRRVLAPGGRVAFLEFAVPRWQPLRALYLLYFRSILPRLGRWFSSDPDAYTYLPESVMEFPQRDGFCRRMEDSGYRDAGWRQLALGIVCLYTGRKPESDAGGTS